VNVPPVQLPDKGVIEYNAVCALLDGLVNVPDIVPALVALTPPVIPPVTFGNDQVYVVPSGIISEPLGVNENELTLQMGAATLFAIVAFGFTVTLIVNVPPVQLPDKGVIEYNAVCALFVGLVKVPDMVPAPVALTPPVIPPVTDGNDQVYVVPLGMTSPVVDENVNELTLHIGVAVFGAIVAIGLTLTLIVKVPP
jgi:hypothetical protein